MNQHDNLKRFLDAQENVYERAYSEIQHGRKQTHWMWFIFPQITGLGQSETSKFYAINNILEATFFLNHSVLGNRLISICEILLKLKNVDASMIFGSPDDQKLFSSMTLFNQIPYAHPVFKNVLAKYFDGNEDIRTINILYANSSRSNI